MKDLLASLSAGAELDARGTVLDKQLLGKILDAFRDPQSGRAEIASGRFDYAEFAGDANFANVAFSGEANFWCATFDGKVDFDGTEFKDGALFHRSRFNQFAVFKKAVFNGVGFREAKFHGSTFFNEAIFNGGAGFAAVEFSDVVAFGGALFKGVANFDFAEFGGLADFASTEFEGDARFDHVVFNHFAHFDAATFGGEALFGPHLGGTKFRRDATFEEVTFRSNADFGRAEFSGGAAFSLARFGGDVRFVDASIAGALLVGPAVIDGSLNLSGIRASGTVRVMVAAKRVGATGGEFIGRAWLTLWGGELSLVDSAFAAPVTVESSLEPIGQVAREEAARLAGRCSPVALRSLRGTDAEHMTLVDVDLGRCVLSGLRRPESLRLDGRCMFAPAPSGWCLRWGWVPWRWTQREALFEEHLWRQIMAGRGRGVGWGARDEQGRMDSGDVLAVAGPMRLTVLYRQLRAAVEDARNEPGAADLYYGEMEMRRLATARRAERWLLTAYWLVSGYGLRAWRALAVLACVVLTAALALMFIGFPGHVAGFWECALYAAGSIVSLDLHGHLPTTLTGWGEVIRLALRVAGPVLLGLAALAVRGRVKR